MLKRKQFLPAVTTTDEQGTSWRDKIKEIKVLGLRKVALFPTCLKKADREEMYKLLEKSGIKEIPFVHIRTDMNHEELDYLIKRYNTKVLNIHTKEKHPVIYDYSKYSSMLYVENSTDSHFDEKELKQYAGICLDVSHLEDEKRSHKKRFKLRTKAIKKYKIGCNHISAVLDTSHIDSHGEEVFSFHYYEKLSEFDYLKSYPEEYFSDYSAVELENSLEEQLKAMDYILSL